MQTSKLVKLTLTVLFFCDVLW